MFRTLDENAQAMTTKPWIGVDVGTVRVGVAVAREGGLAVPHGTFDASEAVERLVDLLVELDTPNVVVGWPLELSGREGLAARRVAAFVEGLERAAVAREHAVNVNLRDERLTTGLAEALLDDAGVHGRKRKGVVDQVAATQILQAFLDESDGRGTQD